MHESRENDTTLSKFCNGSQHRNSSSGTCAGEAPQHVHRVPWPYVSNTEDEGFGDLLFSPWVSVDLSTHHHFVQKKASAIMSHFLAVYEMTLPSS